MGYVLCHVLDLPLGQYRYQVVYQLGQNLGRYSKPSTTECHSARAAMSYANGVVSGALAMGIKAGDCQVFKTAEFEADLQRELAGVQAS